MMGKMIPMEEVPNSYVTKTMSGLIVLPEDSAIARRNPGDGKAHDQSGKICLHPVFLLLPDVSESAFGTSDQSK